MPSWFDAGDSWLLLDWHGRDYQLGNLSGEVLVRKRATGKTKFIRDGELSGGDLAAAYSRMKRRLRLP
jgi:hypothetical protein